MTTRAASFNGYGQPCYTIETDHFRINYHNGLEHVAKETGNILERLYGTYTGIYLLKLPSKTDVLLSDDDFSGGWALSNMNVIHIWANAIEWNLRGTNDWLEDVVAHEFAHVVSIWISQKMPSWMPFCQFGYFSHPNDTVSTKNGSVGLRWELHRFMPQEILPPWFFEGIAQYESSRWGADRWDTHRDMILRTMALSGTMLTWDHMAVFAGRADDFEKTYNQGFSLVKYISEHYGYEKVVAILQRCAKGTRFNFDRSIEDVLGMSARQLYAEWKDGLKKKYTEQIGSIGPQVYGRKVNKDGFDNFVPRFSPDEQKIYFLSNGKRYGMRRSLFSYNLQDTVPAEKKIRLEMPWVNDYYDILGSAGQIVYFGAKSPKSTLPAKQGGMAANDLFITELPTDSDNFFTGFKRKERQVTIRQSLFFPAFSPAGNRLACARHVVDRFYLCLTDTAAKSQARIVYPKKNDPENIIRTIFSIDWSPDGKRIAVSFIDRHDRKIGIYDTLSHTFSILCDTEHDERDPRFSRDGNSLYFASDRSGIYNIYRYNFTDAKLQRLTNVSGGAFTPDISRDQKKLVYANYDASGYSIYLMDSLKVLEEWTADSAMLVHSPVAYAKPTGSFSAARPYSHMPRKLMVIPTLIAEEAITKNNDPFTGQLSVKTGAVLDLFDPMAIDGSGNEFNAYFLCQPNKIHRFINFDKAFFNPEVDYDMGFSGTTSLLPVSLSTSAWRRGISGRDQFYDDGLDTMLSLSYSISPREYDLTATHALFGGSSNSSMGTNLHVRAAYNIYEYYVFINEISRSDFSFNPAQGYRLSTYLTHMFRRYTRGFDISPKGIYFKLLYDFYSQKLYNNDRGFILENGQIKPQYDDYRFHQVTGSFKYGMPTPWYDRHDLYLEYGATGVKLTEESKKQLRRNKVAEALPPYYAPAYWQPGYAYYFKDTLQTSDGKADSLIYDTVLVSGQALMHGMVSYRFPLWPRSLDTKIGWIYLDQLYGAVNVYGGAAWRNARDIFPLRRQDFLMTVGGELRLEALSFSRYPFFLKAKCDYGLDRPAPIGGLRLMFGIGLSFDNWEYIDVPDFQRPLERLTGPRFVGM
jgi:hypothetical protein